MAKHGAASDQTGIKIDPVVKTPARQHTFVDGTVGARNFNPVDASHEDVTRSFSRSHEETVKQINPFGDRNGRQLKPDAPEPEKFSSVEFRDGKKYVVDRAPELPTPTEHFVQPKGPSAPRKRAVGQAASLYEANRASRNPNASINPAGSFEKAEED